MMHTVARDLLRVIFSHSGRKRSSSFSRASRSDAEGGGGRGGVGVVGGGDERFHSRWQRLNQDMLVMGMCKNLSPLRVWSGGRQQIELYFADMMLTKTVGEQTASTQVGCRYIFCSQKHFKSKRGVSQGERKEYEGMLC